MLSRGIKEYILYSVCFHFYSVPSPEIIMSTIPPIFRLNNPFPLRPIWKQVETGVRQRGVLIPFKRENAFFVHLFRNH